MIIVKAKPIGFQSPIPAKKISSLKTVITSLPLRIKQGLFHGPVKGTTIVPTRKLS